MTIHPRKMFFCDPIYTFLLYMSSNVCNSNLTQCILIWLNNLSNIKITYADQYLVKNIKIFLWIAWNKTRSRFQKERSWKGERNNTFLMKILTTKRETRTSKCTRMRKSRISCSTLKRKAGLSRLAEEGWLGGEAGVGMAPNENTTKH